MTRFSQNAKFYRLPRVKLIVANRIQEEKKFFHLNSKKGYCMDTPLEDFFSQVIANEVETRLGIHCVESFISLFETNPASTADKLDMDEYALEEIIDEAKVRLVKPCGGRVWARL